MSNEVPTIWSEGLTVPRLNGLLDVLTLRPFASAALAAQTIRAALNLHGITLPILEVEGGSGGYYGPTVADGKGILAGVETMASPDMYAPTSEGEWLYKIVDADGPDNDFDDTLNLYIVMDLNEDNTIDAYAQIVTDDELGDLSKMDDMTDIDYQRAVGGSIDDIPHEGDHAGESDYQKKIRHIGTLKLPY